MATASTPYEPWEPGITYVIGHQRPDTDAIASALGHAWYLEAIGVENVRAARAGQVGPQAAFALRRFDQKAPGRLTAVGPTFGHATEPEEPVAPNVPLSIAMARLAAGARVVPVVDKGGKPLGALTPHALARAYSQPVSGAEGAKGGSLVEAMPTFFGSDRISDHRGAFLRNDGDDFIVIDEGGRYLGLATRRGVLEPPRARLFLVDHNELAQAVAEADEAELVGVLDHHRLGNAPSAAPIPFVVEPVGSTCTLVAEAARRSGLQPSPGMAGMLLSGLLSDTLVLRSPTTTDRDRAQSRWLSERAGVDVAEFGQELLRASPGLGERPARDILDADRKSYQMGGKAVSIAQVEVNGLQQLPERKPDLLAALDEQRVREGLALACLMVTDIVTGRSHLLCRGDNAILVALPFHRLPDSEWDLEGIVSRKKQLVPALESLLEPLI